MAITKELVAKQIQEGFYNDKHGIFDNKQFRHDLKAINFDLSGSRFSYVHFDFAYFGGINFSNCVFLHCVFRGVEGKSWAGTKLSGAKFIDASKIDKELLEKLEMAAQTPQTRKMLLKQMRERRLAQIKRTLKRDTAYLAASEAMSPREKVIAYRKAMGLNKRKPK